MKTKIIIDSTVDATPAVQEKCLVVPLIVRFGQEEFIDDETIFGVIDAMESIPGMRLAQGDMSYQYTTKPNTSTVIEMLMLEFVKPKKRCANGGN